VIIGLLAASTSMPSLAAPVSIRPLLDLRLRWENVDQDGITDEANAVTLRARAGAEISAGAFSLLGEAEGTAAPVEHYFSGVNGKTGYPLLSDPENIELNRLQLQYRPVKQLAVTAGRQRINIEDQRFVGASGWRQNEQTFDAARVEYGTPRGFQADVTYAWSVRTIWGIDGTGARQQAIRGENIFATASYPTPIGMVTAFAFKVDQDEAIVSAYQQSSQTFGARFAGSRALSAEAKLTYAFSYAHQKDDGKNPNDYSADYMLAELGAAFGGLTVGGSYERLGADDGRPYTSFQTPLATLHKFQGWADKFPVTPPNGIQDYYASAGYGWKRLAGLDSLAALLVYHRFDSDRLDQHYGNEWDAQLSAKKGRWAVAAKFASYSADAFATDTRKFWLQLEWAY
jgi:hypothetical protein